MNIGKAIKKGRQAKGLKQNKFAELCNLSQTHLSQIDNHKIDPSIKFLNLFKSHLDIPLSVLMYLSIEEEDVSPERRNLFKNLNPSVRNLIQEIYFPES